MNLLTKYIPSLLWLRNYKKSDFAGDLSAGITVAVMLIPQGMAYAMLAGLQPIHGLYASVVPLALYALLGTSRQLAVGPVAMVSLLTATGVGALVKGGGPFQPSDFLALSVLLALIVGVMQLAMGLIRLGFLVNFLSHPVISGFTSAAALIIGLSQLKHLLGVDIHRSPYVHKILMQAVAKVGSIHLLTFGLGLAAVVALLLLKRWKPSFPGALFVVVLGTLVVWMFGLSGQGVSIVKKVPAGFPMPSLPVFSWAGVKALWPIALTISLVGFMESISVAKSFAKRHRYQVDANQELIALGTANIAGAFFQAYPVTGGFSRTAINAQAGAKTGLSSLITAALIALTLLFLTPLFYFLPKAILGAIVIVAVFGLIDFKTPVHLWKVKKVDAMLLVLTFFATLSLGIEEGILIGVAASLAAFIYRTTRPHTAELGRLPGTDVYRNAENFPEAMRDERFAILRIDSSFYFANIPFFRDQFSRLVDEREGKLQVVVIDASSINDMDSSAEEALREIAEELKEINVKLLLAGVKGPLRRLFEESGFREFLGAENFFLTVHEAVEMVCHNANNEQGCGFLGGDAEADASPSNSRPHPAIPEMEVRA
ncbi:MAG: solute carrier 26 family protein [Deltaproteobacteria bacterium]|nr:MAG: solute carrier 26 family protein [Deltaproteobacteria bacterium]